MAMKSCCFTGHRMIPIRDSARISAALSQTLRTFADAGITEFICGGALGFDTLAAQAVLKLRQQLPHIRLSMVLPCRNQAERWSAAQRETYNAILAQADETEFLFDRYVNGCMQIRNRRMVDRADVCVAYYTGRPGGTAYTVKYAEEKGIRLFFIPAKEEHAWEA